MISRLPEWRDVGGASPRWPCKVTPESERVRNNEKYSTHVDSGRGVARENCLNGTPGLAAVCAFTFVSTQTREKSKLDT